MIGIRMYDVPRLVIIIRLPVAFTHLGNQSNVCALSLLLLSSTSSSLFSFLPGFSLPFTPGQAFQMPCSL